MTTKSKLDDVLRTFLAYQKAGKMSIEHRKELEAEKEKERRGQGSAGKGSRKS